MFESDLLLVRSAGRHFQEKLCQVTTHSGCTSEFLRSKPFEDLCACHSARVARDEMAVGRACPQAAALLLMRASANDTRPRPRALWRPELACDQWTSPPFVSAAWTASLLIL